FFQAEDGIRDFHVTGVQTCALPISSMIGTDLWELLYDALMPDVQIVFLGDINQIKPVFGDPILAYALKQLEVVELTEVYRTEDRSEERRVGKEWRCGGEQGQEISKG